MFLKMSTSGIFTSAMGVIPAHVHLKTFRERNYQVAEKKEESDLHEANVTVNDFL